MSAVPDGFVPARLFDPFELHVGPIYESGAVGSKRYGLLVDARHVNMNGIVHGGMWMTLADAVLGQAAWDATDRADVVTLSMQSQFLGHAREGDWIETAPVLTKRTRTFLFFNAVFTVRDEPVFSAASVWKVFSK